MYLLSERLYEAMRVASSVALGQAEMASLGASVNAISEAMYARLDEVKGLALPYP